MVGNCLAAVLAAIVGFAVLPNHETFAALSLGIGLVLVPAGTGLALAPPAQLMIFVAVVSNFLPMLAPANQESYDTQQFYNFALGILVGSGAGVLSFSLMPPLSPAFRTRRLLAFTLRDLHRIATGPIPRTPDDWAGRMYSRLSVLPAAAQPLQRSQLLAAFSVGIDMIQLRHICRRVDLGSDLDSALEAFARGSCATAIARLADLDRALISRGTTAVLRARGLVLAISEALSQHAAYFDEGVAG
jgi:uncharacterized membrane protein YccC